MRTQNCFVTLEIDGDGKTPSYSEDFIFMIPDFLCKEEEIRSYCMEKLEDSMLGMGVARMHDIMTLENANSFNWRLFCLHACSEELQAFGIRRLRNWNGQLTKEMLLYRVVLKLK